MSEKYHDLEAALFTEFHTALKSDATGVAQAIRDNERRSRHDGKFRPRIARQRFTTTYYGNGRSFPAQPIMFDYPITDRPTFSSGAVVMEGINNAYVAHATAFVRNYLQNDAGQYIGAAMGYYVTVYDASDTPVTVNVKLEFDLTFEGTTVPVPFS